ncbi:MAG TPA: HD domain-containing protein [Bacteroidales bacterium]|nr:HD domain-containing protein [Bacteroidales bacterium]
MHDQRSNKKKILNDPVYGFISIPDELIFDLIEHSWFQRLRRIKQLGLTHLVYPGALHTRFHHAIGAMHLMQQALEVLISKGHSITNEESLAALIAILLHDMGHGPYSHTLEKVIIKDLDHEALSLYFMKELKNEFGSILQQAADIYTDQYPKKYLHQLVSSQLDTDRLDFLKRDSFFTGVSEGVINSDRIITMLDVVNDNLVVEAKGIYSVEKFLVARRLMYWQVYLHKTVLSAEQMLLQIIRRAKFLIAGGNVLPATPSLKYFLHENISKENFDSYPGVLQLFAKIDDFDIFTAIKEWTDSADKVLSILCNSLVNRHLFRTEIRSTPVKKAEIEQKLETIKNYYGLNTDEAGYFVIADIAQNNAYDPAHQGISILLRDGNLKDISEVSDLLTSDVLSKIVKKYFISYPKAPFINEKHIEFHD